MTNRRILLERVMVQLIGEMVVTFSGNRSSLVMDTCGFNHRMLRIKPAEAGWEGLTNLSWFESDRHGF